MKNFSALFVKAALTLFLSVFFLSACSASASEGAGTDTMDKDTSYAFGMFLAMNSGLGDLHLDYNAFTEGFSDFNEARETRLTQEQAMQKIRVVIMQMQERQNADFLAANAARPGVTTTASGLQYEVTTEGSGNKPGPNDTVRVHYQGTLIDGTEFDSSYARGEPTQFGVSQVIPGWVEGLQLMSEGSVYRFVIPANLAYGENPPPGSPIPPNSILVFNVELIAIVR